MGTIGAETWLYSVVLLLQSIILPTGVVHPACLQRGTSAASGLRNLVANPGVSWAGEANGRRARHLTLLWIRDMAARDIFGVPFDYGEAHGGIVRGVVNV